jgi:hypothetical protein
MTRASAELRWTSSRAAGLATGLAAVLVAGTPAVEAKTPGVMHCYRSVCHRVLTLGETRDMVGRELQLAASWYDACERDRFNPCGLTSSGAVFRPDLADNAASPIFPDGTVLLVYNPRNQRAAVVRVTSAGPYWLDRKLDVSRAVADALGFREQGVAALVVRVIRAPTVSETRYRARRDYDKVPGPIGTFETAALAHATLALHVDLGPSADRQATALAPLGDGDAAWPRLVANRPVALGAVDERAPRPAVNIVVAALSTDHRPIDAKLSLRIQIANVTIRRWTVEPAAVSKPPASDFIAVARAKARSGHVPSPGMAKLAGEVYAAVAAANDWLLAAAAAARQMARPR